MIIKNGISISQRLHEELGKIIAETPPGERLLTEPALAKAVKRLQGDLTRSHADL